MTLLITLPGEMNDIATAFRKRAALDPRLSLFDLQDGLCNALNQVPLEDQNLRLQSREITSSKSYTCRIDVAINDFPLALSENAIIAGFAGLTSSGERTYRYQMETMPMALGELAWRGIVQQQFKEQGVEVTAEQLNDIVASDKAALVAAAVMMFRGASSTVTIRAPEIVETNGTIAEDRKSVTFRTEIADAVSMLLEPENSQTPFLVFRY